MKVLMWINFISILVGIGRFTIPGHHLTGWAGLYEATAHIWIGALIVLSIRRNDIPIENQAYVSIARWGLGLLTVLEIVMFAIQVGIK